MLVIRDLPVYYKAVRPDGTDFWTGTVNYLSYRQSVIRHPRPHRVDASGYLSVSVSKTDCTGFMWPARLLVVEPVGDIWFPARDVWSPGRYPNKRACHALRVVDELPPHELLGPQGERIVALIERAHALSEDELDRLVAATAADRSSAWFASGYAVVAAQDAAGNAARAASRDAARAAAGVAARDAARRIASGDAALGLSVRDLISDKHYDTLTAPWRRAIGRIHPDDVEI